MLPSNLGISNFVHVVVLDPSSDTTC